MKVMNTAASTAIFLSLSCVALPAAAIYKCEQAGVVTYTDIPCDGQQLPVAVPDKPHETDDKSLAREKREVAKLQAIREQRERQDKQIRDLSTRGAAARERKCKSLALQLKWREEDVRDAPLSAQDKARKMARRAAEKYRNDCQ
ncbi:MAG: DUF4124 domain-containing protein [Oxalobacteraceae bacterium]|jgi:hypothetical protein|nr:DUF4124 domain-containing protein [Oxalobacteraceae bacterium]